MEIGSEHKGCSNSNVSFEHHTGASVFYHCVEEGIYHVKIIVVLIIESAWPGLQNKT